MKIKFNEENILYVNDTKCKVIMNDIHADEFDADMKRRLKWVLMHKYEQCFKRLKEEWEPKLKENGVKEIPLDNDEFAEMVFQQHNYKDRKTRDLNADTNVR